ncbi:pentatricopeptide repeat-containing protein At3g12770-like [Selaginella moellendorffii]|uniref:pentatricopeptide repeat-containing protein At3g12770-like n=1 Tax=Selaginella moellendorffii TaxID=88036 RepID=UPI000D1D0C7C|nr:pentatricopeptide repeat-containing protein At3g12770-like [Selaginella moellendorffii]|eukprot:XP_024530858.1 pentatricopeptide repeat-containing protein At3g12770-like [Selaginella moellendorffii]
MRAVGAKEAREAIRAFDRMREDSVAPSVAAQLAALKACISLRDLQAGARIHGHIGDGANIFVANTIVDMYAKCGSMVEARRAFDSIRQHSVVSWNAIIKGYAQRGQGEVALDLFSVMKCRGFKPNAATYVAALKACAALAVEGAMDCLDRGKALHSQAASSGLGSNLFVASSLVDMYSKCGDMESAKVVFDAMVHHDVVLWNSLILGYVDSGDGETALELFSHMQDRGFVPNVRTFTAALAACTALAIREEGTKIEGKLVKVSALEKGNAVHSQLKNAGETWDIYLESALVDMYVKCGSIIEARWIFDRMPRHDVVSWTALIMGHAQSGEGDLALELFSRMQEEGCVPNALTYVGALEACISIATREDLSRDQLDKKVCLEKAAGLHFQLVKQGHEAHSLVASTLVDMYSKCGSMAEAREVFERTRPRDLLLWNAMIRGYSQSGEAEVALRFYARMRDEGIVPVSQTFVSALKACGSLADLQTGKSIHSHIRSAGLEHDEAVASSLISFYGKCADMQEAQEVFDSLTTRGLVTWNSLIAGYSHHGHAKQAIYLFQRMQEERLQPNRITFLCILTACSHAGLVEKGKEVFDTMISDHGIAATIEHYSCLVDTLARGNYLDEAMAMIKTMPFQPNLTIWRAILAASRKWRNVETGRLAFDSIVRADERDAAAYSVMATIYAAAGMFEESLSIRTMRNKARAFKKPGQSWWIDESGRVHRFCAGDTSHPQSSQILAKLKEVMVSLKQAGYVPDWDGVLFDIADEEKENALCGHSEKLAIGCALVNTKPGTSIHIAKNLRACDDCHRATSIISRIEQRVVVCRDASRFHVFRDGVCSCGDFW